MKFEELYNTLLLEKDNRPKILKLGIPQNVADYLHSLSDKYSLWFADKIARMPDYQTARDKFRYVHSLQTQIQGIIDWIRGAQNIPINNFDWNSALNASREWHEKLTISNTSRETNTILKEYSDGYYWVDLESSSDTCEKGAMGHCATTSKGDTLYSLRKHNRSTNEIESFITIAVSPDEGTWFQCKGRKNSKPKEEYHKYIVDIFVTKNIFKFKTEYDSSADFKPEDFVKFLEENPDIYDNTNELIEKVNEDKIGYEDFEKILKRYEESFKYIFITLHDDDYDDSNSIYTSYSANIEIKKDSTDLTLDCLDVSTKAAKDYLGRILDVNVSDVDVQEGYQDKNIINISIILEDVDNAYSMDEEGLASFERQCEYYDQLNEKFDYEEFMSEQLEKLLTLDECIENSSIEIKKGIEKLFPRKGYYEQTIRIEQKYPSYDLNLEIVTDKNFYIDIDREAYSSQSQLRSYYEDTIDIEAIDKFESAGLKKTKDSDVLLLYMFWDFIKRNVLKQYSQNMRIRYFKSQKRFYIRFVYDFDEDYDVDEELYHVKRFVDFLPLMSNAFRKFINDVMRPFIATVKPLTIKDFTFEPGNYDSDYVHIYLNGYSVGIDNKANITDEKLKNIIADRAMKGSYAFLDENKVRKWFNDNLDPEPQFSSMFEQYVKNLL
jgi:hypothetical protein